MKKLIMLCALVLLPLVSCEDIINSDQNIVKENILYNRVLDDQTNSVIKPLKTGNTWIYDVYTYSDPSNFELTYDTLVVLDQIEIKDEKWFQLNKKTPHKYGYLTNTDKGLFENCNCPEDGAENDLIILKAQYPAKINDKNTGQTYPVLFIEEDGITVIYESHMVQVLSAKEIITVNDIKYNCYKYTTYGDITDKNDNIISRDTLYVDYYCPDIGLVKHILFSPTWRDSNNQLIPRIVVELKEYELK